MKNIKIVIGANFGDEGKGLMTDYFANEAKQLGKSCLVICHNGGSQKGHTVVSPSGLRHVFHHFGSGAFAKADTYLSEEYIVNPIIFNKEYEELKRKGITTKCFVHPKCKITTPFDMMINQIIEETRSINKHGSCGLGIYETIIRNIDTTMWNFLQKDYYDRFTILNYIASTYLPKRLKELGVKKFSRDWFDILDKKDVIIKNFISDFDKMISNITIIDDSIIDSYDYIIFEGAQGLLLDQNNIEYMPHLTPSNTGIRNPLNIIGDTEHDDIEVCYVSRTYMTRHGAGRFDSECRKEKINPKIIDLTNVPNPYQDSLRYGFLDLNDLRNRIDLDLAGKKFRKSISFTHYNEYTIDLDMVHTIFSDYKIYVSDGMTYNDVN